MSRHVFQSPISKTMTLAIECEHVCQSTVSPYQKIEVIESRDFGRMLVLDNVINLTERDEFVYHEMLAHVPLFSHPRPEKVLIIGGGDGCTAREVLKHRTVKRVLQVEIDAVVMEVSRKYFKRLHHALDNPRVEIVCQDALQYMEQTRESFDVILLDSTDQVIEQSSGLFSTPFFRRCFATLTKDGILGAQVGDSSFEPHVVSQVFRNLRQVFPLARMYLASVPSYTIVPYSFAFCSKGVRPEERLGIQRFDSAFRTRYYNPEMHRASFALPEHVREDFEL